MHRTRIRLVIVSLVGASLLAACGGGGGGGGAVGQAGSDPAATVNSLIATLQAKALDKLPDLACAASKDSISSGLDPASGAGSAMGVTTAEILAAVNIAVTNVTVGAPAITGDTAKVHLKAEMKMTANPDKMKELIKKMLTAAGREASDAVINAAMAAVGSQFDKTTPIDTDIPLANEGGKWLICGDISSLTGN